MSTFKDWFILSGAIYGWVLMIVVIIILYQRWPRQKRKP